MHTIKAQLTPESSATDSHSYRWLQLENGLRVLLVHNASSKQSSASFAVNAGHFHDPIEAQGIAHFLEHLIFLGSASFPEANAFANRINNSSGHFNAWTGTEHSNYYFACATNEFSDCVKHFSSLFKEPLLKQEWVDKERQSIEAEYRLKLKDELRRLYEVHKTTSNPAHPFAKFSVGNAETLADTNITIRARLEDFHQTFYVANNAALVLAGSQSLTELQEIALAHFADMRAGEAAINLPAVPIYQEQHKSCQIYVRPIKQANRLILTFPLDEINSDYLHKTTSFLAHLLGHEGSGSLCYFLRQQHWIQELSAGGGMSGYNFKDFHLNIQLTDLGTENIQHVVQACFQYIRVIAAEGIQNALYNERKQMMALAYQFPEAIQTVELASQLAINMLHYAPEHVVSGDYRMDGLRDDLARVTLSKMVPENARITLIHPQAPVNQKTQYYGAEYKIEPLTSEQLSILKQPVPETLQANFQVPETNPYTPKRIVPLPIAKQLHSEAAAVQNQQCERTGYYPNKLSSPAGVTLWHLQDAHFREPQAHIYLSLQLPLANASARNHAISRVWCELGQELLSEQFYDAEVAGMHFNLYPQQSGITLHLSGFSDRQPALFKDLMRSLAALRSSKQHFHTVRQQLQRNWQAIHQNKPINHLFSLLHHQLQHGAYTAQQLADSIVDLDFEHYCDLLPGMLRDAQAIILAHGDIEQKTAGELANWVAQTLPVIAEPKSKVSRSVKRLNSGVQTVPFLNEHSDHAFALFFQGQNTGLHEKAHFLVLNHLFSSRFFHSLRTEQQMGYLVGSSYLPMHGLPGLLCYVQSPNYVPADISAAVEGFITQFLEQLATLPAADFVNAQKAVLHHLTDSAPSMRVRAQRYWSSVINNRGDFELANRVAETVRNITHAELVAFATKRLRSERCAMALADNLV